MTDRELMQMAREAGVEMYPSPTNDVRLCTLKNLERFAALVAAAEREACAKVCELIAINAADNRASECAFAIRERGAP